MSDDTENYRYAQGKHAEDMRTERELQRETGLSRSQIRRGLREFAVQQSKVPQAVAPVVASDPPQTQPIQSNTTVFDPQPFRLSSESGIGSSSGANPTDDGTYQTYIVDATTGAVALYTINATPV